MASREPDDPMRNDRSSPPALVLVCSVELEAAPLRSLLDRPEPGRAGRKPLVRGWLDSTPVRLLTAGMGKTNAAQALTAAIEAGGVAGVIGFGVGGAYAGSGLDVGGLALAGVEVYGDEGVAAPQGWVSTEGIGIPLHEQDGVRRFNEFGLDAARVRAAGERLRAEGMPAVAGPFVTVSCCSGTARRGAELAERFGAVCESMEGAAYAHVAAVYELPFLEVRGISNHVEDRDTSRWRLTDAARAGARAAALLARHWDTLRPEPGP